MNILLVLTLVFAIVVGCLAHPNIDQEGRSVNLLQVQNSMNSTPEVQRRFNVAAAMALQKKTSTGLKKGL